MGERCSEQPAYNKHKHRRDAILPRHMTNKLDAPF
jgi:hypothetical protein